MDRRTLITVGIALAAFLGYQKLYVEPRAHEHAAALELQQKQTQVIESATAAEKANKKPDQVRTLVTDEGSIVVNDSNPIFKQWKLKSFRKGLAAETANIDFTAVTNIPGEVELGFDLPSLAYLNTAQWTPKDAEGRQWSFEDSNVSLTRTIETPSGQPYLNMTFTAQFKTAAPKFAFVSLTSMGAENDPEARDRQLLYYTNDTVDRLTVKDAQKLQSVPSPTAFIAAANRYFVMAVVNEGTPPNGLVQPLGPAMTRVSLVYPMTGALVTIPTRVYFGPKNLDLLRQVDPRLDHVVDFGWFTIFAYPILKFLKFLYGICGNYGVAIILLTVLLKLVTFPLTYKSMKSMKEMAKLQPQLARIREKYKDDKESLNREMMALMRTHGYNPMAGCLPILIQMPIFFALYRVLYSSIELYHAPFALWIHDLSAKDPIYVFPVLMTVMMFVQQKLTPAQATQDPAQAKMMQFMPVIFGVFMLTYPSGLTIYMLTNSLASIVQQLFLNKKLGGVSAQPVPATAR